MKFSSLVPLLLLSCYLMVFPGVSVSGTNEANRLRAMMKSHASSSPRVKPWLQAEAKKSTYDSVYIGPQEGLKEADRIHALPGQPDGVDFDQFAGYVTVDPKSGRELFYYFVEAPIEPYDKPLVLWLNGGPGCSSLGAGGMLELGPFFVNRDGKTLYRNKYAWNNEANVLFLESPAGVGFSYSNTTTDYDESGDKRTADDSYTFLVNWLQRFPQYKGRDFFITGESYAGHYIPELASTIITNNNITRTSIINLKGVAIGNAYVDGDTNNRATYDYLLYHAFLSREAHEEIQKECSFVEGNYSQGCYNAMDSADKEVGIIDYYNIYAPRCQESSNVYSFNGSIPVEDPCADSYVFSYLNLPEVQRALHANTTGLSYPWSDCSNFIGSSKWKDAPLSVLPIIKKLISQGIRVWLYSGDIDAVVPILSTQYSLDVLGLPIETSWQVWNTNNEVAGYVIGYRGLTFASVRGAGHMVPRYQRERSLVLFNSFLKGELPPQ